MRRASPARVLTLAAVLVVVVLGSGRHTDGAAALTGETAGVRVSVEPSRFPADGQPITVEAVAPPGVEIFEIRVHLCQHDAAIANTYDFGITGPFCSPNPVSPAADTEVKQLVPAGSRDRVAVTFRNGLGTGAPWTDEFGGQHQLTCSPTQVCDLVVQLQITDDTVFFTAPLDGSVATTTTTTTPVRQEPTSTGVGGADQGAATTPTTTVDAAAAPAPDGSGAGTVAATPTASPDGAIPGWVWLGVGALVVGVGVVATAVRRRRALSSPES